MKKLLQISILACFAVFILAYTGGAGSSGDPYEIATAVDLITLSQSSADWGKHFIQTADIVFNADETTVDWDGDGSEDGINPIGFLPIGDGTTAFTGTYDGDGFSVSNLFIDRATTQNGLFGVVAGSGAWIKNLANENCDITGAGRTGGLVGYLELGATIDNCSSSGSVTNTSTSTGGLLGNISASTVSNCHSSATVTSNKEYIGGLVGYNKENASIIDSYATGNVSGYRYVGGLLGYTTSVTISNSYATGDVSGSDVADQSAKNIGGLLGYATSTTILNSHASGAVTSTGEYTGGFAGKIIESEITNCFASGAATGNGVYTTYEDFNHVGGFAGASSSTTITNSYASGAVTSTGPYTGGFAGDFSSSTISKCYASGNVTSVSNYVGGFAGNSETSSTIENCYAKGDVGSNANLVGGFIGYNNASVSKCYETGHTVQTGGTGDSFGHFCGFNNVSIEKSFCLDGTPFGSHGTKTGVTSKNSIELRTESTYTNEGWDFINIWSIDVSETINEGYAYLEDAGEVPLAISLVSFAAEVRQGLVELNWEVASQTNNTAFLIYRNDKIIARIEGAGSTTESISYSFVDDEVIPGVKYTYVLADVDYANVLTRYDDKAITITLDNDLAEADFVIGSAYPNPFNPSVTLSMEYGVQGQTIINIYNAQGRLLDQLYSGMLEAGIHEVNWNASNMPSGVYIISVQTNDIMNAQKVVLMK